MNGEQLRHLKKLTRQTTVSSQGLALECVAHESNKLFEQAEAHLRLSNKGTEPGESAKR